MDIQNDKKSPIHPTDIQIDDWHTNWFVQKELNTSNVHTIWDTHWIQTQIHIPTERHTKCCIQKSPIDPAYNLSYRLHTNWDINT